MEETEQSYTKWLCCSYSTPKTDANLRIYTQTKYQNYTIHTEGEEPPEKESESESESERGERRRERLCVCEIERAERRECLQHVLLFLYSTNMCVLVLYCSYCYVCVLVLNATARPPTHPNTRYRHES